MEKNVSACGCSSCDPENNLDDNPPESYSFFSSLYYGYDSVFKDIALTLGIGIFTSALITTLLPEGLFSSFRNSPWIYMIVLLLSLPLYVCATSSIPLAWSLIHTGLAPGAAMVFLIAGPATNLSTLGVLLKEYGKQRYSRYIFTIITVSILSGWLFDSLLTTYPVSTITPLKELHTWEYPRVP